MVRSIPTRAGGRVLCMTALCLAVQPLFLLLHLAFGHAHALAGAAHGHGHGHGPHEHEHHRGDEPDAQRSPRPSDSDEPSHPLEDHLLEHPPLASVASSSIVLLALPTGTATCPSRPEQAYPAPEGAPASPRGPPPRAASPSRAPPIAS